MSTEHTSFEIFLSYSRKDCLSAKGGSPAVRVPPSGGPGWQLPKDTEAICPTRSKHLGIRWPLPHAVWQRDLFVSSWCIATMAEQNDGANALDYWRKASNILNNLKERDMLPSDEPYLQQLGRKEGL